MDNGIKDTLLNAVKVFGREKQVEMAIEEMGELLVAINQHKRGRVSVEAVQEEIADVKIMVEQLAIIYGENGVSNFETKKGKRLEERIVKHLEKCKTASRY